MKRRKPWAGPINSTGKRLPKVWLHERRGSIVLEAALVMPFILFLLVILSLFISMCAAQMALHMTASQSVRQIAAHIYPIELARAQLDRSGATEAASERQPLPEWSETAAEIAEWLPDPAGKLVSSALRGDWRPLQNVAATELGRAVIEPFVRQYAYPYLLRADKISLDYIALPDLKEKEEPYIAIALKYEYPVRLPFYSKPIILREQAYERVWISDATAATYGMDEEDGDTLPLHIVSIEPTPVRPGNKATVIVKTEPGAVVSLGVNYKSGASKAKHLGDATADENGYVEWTWHVSGNTTPGIWELAVEGVSKPGSVAKHFSVEKKQK
ncbi:TadE/TadG family type IV pilus assembly protein [Paenibacillus sp. NPDC057967]|uniref:TadE/TadG family type IV pilus assembly protein n=1 Tax=Paenibacillus sp. NPDC057967 TaxID=3346293 RepID=UPI0036DDD7D9